MLDLRALAGSTYRTEFDESAEMTGQTREERLWLVRIPCRRGHVYVHGENTLGAWTDRRPTAKRLEALDGTRVHQRGDREMTVTFAPERLEAVCEILLARKQRHPTVSDELKAKRMVWIEKARAVQRGEGFSESKSEAPRGD